MAGRGDQIIEAIIELTVPLKCDGSIAGTAHPITIGANQYEILVPNIDGRGQRSTVSAPPMESVRKDVDWYDVFHDHIGWGQIRGWSGPLGAAQTTSFDLARVLVRRTFPTAPDAPATLTDYGNELHQLAAPWLDLAILWMEVASGQLLTEQMVTVESHRSQVWGYDGTKYTHVQHPSPQTISVSFGTAVDAQTWSRGIAAASKGSKIPAEYQFLKSARVARHSHDSRRAVLDAATAAEIAMAKMLDNELASSTPTAAELVRKKWRQIGGLAEALDKFGISVPIGTRNTGLAEPRNRAVHSGVAPSDSEVTQAIMIAEALVEMATPAQSLV